MEDKYSVQDLQDNLDYLNETKRQIKNAIIAKGQSISSEDTFRSYVDKIAAIELDITQTQDYQNCLSLANHILGIQQNQEV